MPSRYLVGLGPGQEAQVVRPPRPGAPLLVVRQHEIVVLVVATLLLRALHARRARRDAVHRAPVQETLRVGVPVAVGVRQEAAAVHQRVVQRARALEYLGREVLQVPVVLDPVVAQLLGPPVAVPPFPLRREVPAERHRLAPQNSEKSVARLKLIRGDRAFGNSKIPNSAALEFALVSRKANFQKFQIST